MTMTNLIQFLALALRHASNGKHMQHKSMGIIVLHVNHHVSYSTMGIFSNVSSCYSRRQNRGVVPLTEIYTYFFEKKKLRLTVVPFKLISLEKQRFSIYDALVEAEMH